MSNDKRKPMSVNSNYPHLPESIRTPYYRCNYDNAVEYIKKKPVEYI